MGEFTYVNIFETKGLEYLIIIAFLLLLIPFAYVLNRKVKITHHVKQVLGILSANILKIPQGLFFSQNHTWTHLEKSGAAHVGLDDLLLHLTGEVQLRILKNPGDMIRKGDLLTEIDHDGKLLRIYSPISGILLKTNLQLNENPGMINNDPYNKGWICKIKPSNWKSDIQEYYFAETALEWTKQELERFKNFLTVNVNKYSTDDSRVILQDGGELSDHSLTALPDALWKDFQREFLNPSV